MTKQEKIDRMVSILKLHEIEMSVGGCGCCGSPYVEFIYKGEKLLSDEDASFNTRYPNE